MAQTALFFFMSGLFLQGIGVGLENPYLVNQLNIKSYVLPNTLSTITETSFYIIYRNFKTDFWVFWSWLDFFGRICNLVSEASSVGSGLRPSSGFRSPKFCYWKQSNILFCAGILVWVWLDYFISFSVY